MGANVVLVEKGKMGGDCLNYGCVPSKALLAAAKQAYGLSQGAKFGTQPQAAKTDFSAVREHVADVIATIAPHDSVERFEGLGVRVVQSTAKFIDARTVQAGEALIKARRFVIATGSRAAVPPIEGLNQTPYFTNETIFDNGACPSHLIIIGGGPIGMEMAQAHRRLGAKVTVLEGAHVLSKDDPELVDVVVQQLAQEGVNLRQEVRVQRIEQSADGINVFVSQQGQEEKISGSHLLVATGRRPNIEDLNLSAAGIKSQKGGIDVDARMRTSNKRVFAIGDVVGGLQFTHMANYHAGIVIRNALFRLPANANTTAVPWVTYTDPELAHVGLSEAQARKVHGEKLRVLTSHFSDNDRAIAERNTDGMIKVMVAKNGRILGASIVGAGAGDLIQPWVLAISSGLKIGALATQVVAYPTRGEISKRAAGAFYTPSLYSPRMRFLVKLLAKLG
jgi:pyruvate/2-oxoglutarate dehydrogenase complex dihydrolipoamide dehydrogenase (E3) component